MGIAAATPLRAAEPREPRHTPATVAYPHRLGRVNLAAEGPNPVSMVIGRGIHPMTADEADSLALALAKAAADSRRVIR